MESPTKSLKQVIVFRKDIQMNKGKMIAQGAHAAMMCLLDTFVSAQVNEWAHGAMAKIAAGVDTLEELDALEAAAREAGLLVYAVNDSGKTVFKGIETKTCIAIGPAKSEDIDKITGHLKLI